MAALAYLGQAPDWEASIVNLDEMVANLRRNQSLIKAVIATQPEGQKELTYTEEGLLLIHDNTSSIVDPPVNAVRVPSSPSAPRPITLPPPEPINDILAEEMPEEESESESEPTPEPIIDFDYDAVIAAFGFKRDSSVDDTTPVPEEYEDLQPVEVLTRPTRVRKAVERFKQDEINDDEEEEDSDGRVKKPRAKNARKRKFPILEDSDARNVRSLIKETPHTVADLMQHETFKRLCTLKTAPHRTQPLPQFLRFSQPLDFDNLENASWRCWWTIFQDAAIAVIAANLSKRPFSRPVACMSEDYEKMREEFRKWRQNSYNDCCVKLTELSEEDDEYISILRLVLLYQRVSWCNTGNDSYAVLFSMPRLHVHNKIPEERAFNNVSHQTFFQIKALCHAVDPYALMLEMLSDHYQNLLRSIGDREAQRKAFSSLIQAVVTNDKRLMNLAAGCFKLWWLYQSYFKCNVAGQLVDKRSREPLDRQLFTFASGRRVGLH